MDRSKRFTNFFHNFVVMKKSVNFLPENKRNDLKQLVDLVRRNIKDVGMGDTPEEKRLFDLLQRAYIESRYNPDFEITKADIDALLPKIELLRDVVEQVCNERLAYYDSRIEK